MVRDRSHTAPSFFSFFPAVLLSCLFSFSPAGLLGTLCLGCWFLWCGLGVPPSPYLCNLVSHPFLAPPPWFLRVTAAPGGVFYLSVFPYRFLSVTAAAEDFPEQGSFSFALPSTFPVPICVHMFLHSLHRTGKALLAKLFAITYKVCRSVYTGTLHSLQGWIGITCVAQLFRLPDTREHKLVRALR